MKVTDYPLASVVDNSDTMYLIQTSGSAKISKKVLISKFFEKINIKSIFSKGVNYGTTPQSLTDTGTIAIDSGITALICTQNASFILPNGSQGDEVIILVEANPSFTCTVTGTFALGSNLVLGQTGTTARCLFHHGKWYIL
jgi:hypothetical protein